MEKEKPGKKNLVRKLLTAGLVLLLIGGAAAWYMLTKTFDDTATTTADYTVNALDLIKEFKQGDSAANKKYAEKIITVNGRISAIEAADTTLNVRMDDPSGSYVIFAFQRQDFEKVKKLKAGDSASVKGSCSGGAYSDILETEFITFKRCSVNK